VTRGRFATLSLTLTVLAGAAYFGLPRARRWGEERLRRTLESRATAALGGPVRIGRARILAYSKKDRTLRMKFIDYGLGVFSAKAFERVRTGEPRDLADLYGELLAAGKLAGMEVSRRFYEIGSEAGLEETARFLASQGVGRR